jgi:hypothetical protein
MYFVWWRNVVAFPGGLTTKVFGEKEEVEYDKNRDNKDGKTTVRNKGNNIGREKGILRSYDRAS